MKKIKLLICLIPSLNILPAEKSKNNLHSKLSQALGAIQSSNSKRPEDFNLTDCIDDSIAGGTLLHHAICRGQIPWVKKLILQGANTNKLSNSGYSPLQIAGSFALLGNCGTHNSNKISRIDLTNYQIWNLLIENKADPRSPDITSILPAVNTTDKQAPENEHPIRASAFARMDALNRCDQFLKEIKTAKLSQSQIRALPIYPVFADHNPQLSKYLAQLDQQEAENLCPVDIFQCKDKSSPDKEIYIGNKRARNKAK